MPYLTETHIIFVAIAVLSLLINGLCLLAALTREGDKFPRPPRKEDIRVKLYEAMFCANCETIYPAGGRCTCSKANSSTPLSAWISINPFVIEGD